MASSKVTQFQGWGHKIILYFESTHLGNLGNLESMLENLSAFKMKFCVAGKKEMVDGGVEIIKKKRIW